eukprot:PITA_29175
MATSSVVLPKLVGTNYFHWSKHIQPIFITKYLWELVTDGYNMPSPDEFKASSDDEKESLKELIKKDNEALSLIGNALEESIFPRTSGAISSKKAWDILKNTFEGVVVAKLQTLRRNFENSHMQSNESIHDYITKMQNLVNQMRSLEEEEGVGVNIIIKIEIEINKVHKEPHHLQEVEVGIPTSLEEEAEMDLAEEDKEEMEEEMEEEEEDHSVIITKNLAILKEIVMQNCEIRSEKVLIQLLKKVGMRSYSSQV